VVLAGEIYELDENARKLQISSPDFGYKVSFVEVPPQVFQSLKLHYRRPVQIRGTVLRTLGDIISAGAREASIEEGLVTSLVQTLWNILLEPQGELRRSTIHGDLNLGNIRTDGTHLWLIDFARTGQGPIVYDFAKLEIEMRITLTDAMQGDSLAYFLEFEAAMRHHGVTDDSMLPLLSMIRERGIQHYCVAPEHAREYHVALLLYSLNALKFGHSPKIKRHLLAVALTAAAQLTNA
jgi:hypothetical protein